MARRPAPIMLSAEERSELERLIRSHSTPQHLARRARMIVHGGRWRRRRRDGASGSACGARA